MKNKTIIQKIMEAIKEDLAYGISIKKVEEKINLILENEGS